MTPARPALAERTAALGIRVLRYGSDPAQPLAGTLLNWEQQGTGAVAHIQLAGEAHPRVMRLAVPGRHMALNALGALLAAIEVGAPADVVLDGLAGFEGVRRRFELVGTANGVRVFDDYAHHPTEVRATLTARAGGGPAGRPGVRPVHRRVPAALVFADKDFRARVRPGARCSRRGVRARRVRRARTADGRRERGDGRRPRQRAGAPTCRTSPRWPNGWPAAADPGDVVVTMGAGDVTMLGTEILAALQAKANRSAPGGRGRAFR